MKVFIFILKNKKTKEPYIFTTVKSNKNRADLDLENSGLLKTHKRWQFVSEGLFAYLFWILNPLGSKIK